MDIKKDIECIFEYYKNIRRYLHTIPEIGFNEFQTSQKVIEELGKLNIPYKKGFATTGIIAWLKCGNSDKNIAFRADMDALEIEEKNHFAHKSCHTGMMHACGHDGHTATLLAFAKLLTLHKEKFDGTIYLIFQPAEEGLGGAKKMLEDGMLNKYKVDKIFSVHNRPSEDFGKIFVKMGTMMASYDNYKITIHGKSTHSSMPQTGKNPIIVAAHIVTAIKSISSLDISPIKKSVVTVASINGGMAPNIIPDTCEIGGSIRAYEDDVRDDIEKRIKEIAEHIALGFGMRSDVNYHKGYPSTINTDIQSALDSAKKCVGEENLVSKFEPSFGAEDFSYFLEKIPGCYAWLGSKVGKDTNNLHNSKFDFNDDLIKIGAEYFFNIAKYELGEKNDK
eukprot:Anaeramoba_flamelloidesa325643_52.p1 GENE.a325643_52~~a325643_52.p1  ORF type:complete len:392 (-),score=19.83 a325643_52:8-1183(-)